MCTSRFFASAAAGMCFILSTQSAVASCAPSILSSPSIAPRDAILIGIGGTSGTDVWAVGRAFRTGLDPDIKTLVEHFDGTAWAVVPSPNIPRMDNALSSVSATTPTDAWAVGAGNDSSSDHMIAIHWNGSTWTLMNPPKLSGCYRYSSALSSVSVNPSNGSDVWAIGNTVYGCTPDRQDALAEHWDGTKWEHIVVANIGQFEGVATTPAGDAWAVGGATGSHGRSRPYINHLVGRKATEWPAPDACCSLSSVSADSATDVWAVGLGIGKPIVEHFDGVKWSSVAIAAPERSFGAVNAVSPSNVWIAGTYEPINSPNTVLTAVERWDGSIWSAIPSENVGEYNFADGIFGLPSGAITTGYFIDVVPSTIVNALSMTFTCSGRRMVPSP